MEKKDGKFVNSVMMLLEGNNITPPVKIYPTSIEGNVVNMRTDFPVQRASIVSAQGQQVFAKDLNGINGTAQLTIPSIPTGVYWMTFYGDGWKSTQKIIVGR